MIHTIDRTPKYLIRYPRYRDQPGQLLDVYGKSSGRATFQFRDYQGWLPGLSQ
jgi:hypothetical protein